MIPIPEILSNLPGKYVASMLHKNGRFDVNTFVTTGDIFFTIENDQLTISISNNKLTTSFTINSTSKTDGAFKIIDTSKIKDILKINDTSKINETFKRNHTFKINKSFITCFTWGAIKKNGETRVSFSHFVSEYPISPNEGYINSVSKRYEYRLKFEKGVMSAMIIKKYCGLDPYEVLWTLKLCNIEKVYWESRSKY